MKINLDDIKVRVEFTPGYRERFTAACLEVLANRKRMEELEKNAPRVSA